MSDFFEKKINVAGEAYTLKALSGVVLDSTQRSDTHVSGSGSSLSYNGSGGGNMHVSSTVVVTSNFWMRGKSGKEYHLQYSRDIPARAGNVIHIVSCSGKEIPSRDIFIYNSATEELYFVGDGIPGHYTLWELGKRMLLWPIISATAVLLVFGFSAFLLAVFVAVAVFFFSGQAIKDGTKEFKEQFLSEFWREVSKDLDKIAPMVAVQS